MHIVKPSWLTHGGSNIPNCNRADSNRTANASQESSKTTKYTVAMSRQMESVSSRLVGVRSNLRTGARKAESSIDGHVRIWSIEALLKSRDQSFTGPKQLAAISNHSGTIHAVRFSGNNKYLASGADDKIVCVYTLDPNPPSHGSTFGLSALESLEYRGVDVSSRNK